jgi:hypothetical protein
MEIMIGGLPSAVSLSRLGRLLQLWAILPDCERILRHDSIRAVDHEFETLRQECLQHRSQGLFIRFGRGFGDNVEALGIEPRRTPCDSFASNLKCRHDKKFQSAIGKCDSAR